MTKNPPPKKITGLGHTTARGRILVYRTTEKATGLPMVVAHAINKNGRVKWKGGLSEEGASKLGQLLYLASNVNAWSAAQERAAFRKDLPKAHT